MHACCCTSVLAIGVHMLIDRSGIAFLLVVFEIVVCNFKVPHCIWPAVKWKEECVRAWFVQFLSKDNHLIHYIACMRASLISQFDQQCWATLAHQLVVPFSIAQRHICTCMRIGVHDFDRLLACSTGQTSTCFSFHAQEQAWLHCANVKLSACATYTRSAWTDPIFGTDVCERFWRN